LFLKKTKGSLQLTFLIYFFGMSLATQHTAPSHAWVAGQRSE